MKFLVTGASSYVAKYIIDHLLFRGHHVVGTSRSNPQIVNTKFKWIRHDLSVEPLQLNDQIDIIIHVAGLAWMGRNNSDYVQSNIIVTWNLLKTIKGLSPQLIVYTSTRDVYGEVVDKVLTEKSNIINPIVYGHTKFVAESLIKETCNYLILRLPSVIGIGTHGWIRSIFLRLRENEEIKYKNAPFNNIIHACEIPRVIEAFLLKKKDDSGTYLVGCSDHSTSEKVIIAMKKKMGSESKLIEIPSEHEFYTISTDKVSEFYKSMTVGSSVDVYVEEMQSMERYLHK